MPLERYVCTCTRAESCLEARRSLSSQISPAFRSSNPLPIVSAALQYSQLCLSSFSARILGAAGAVVPDWSPKLTPHVIFSFASEQ